MPRLRLDPFSPSGVSIVSDVVQRQAPGYVVNKATGLISAGTNVSLTGNGTTDNPYIISSSGSGGGSASDATTSAKGIIQLAGDLTGTAVSPQLANTIGSSGTTASSGTVIPVISYDTKGRITALSSTSIAASTPLNPTPVKTSAYTASANDFVPVDTTSGPVIITLPNAPANGTRFGVKMVIQGGTNTITVTAGGADVFNKTGGNTSVTITLLNQGVQFQYYNGIWYGVAADIGLTALDARYAPITGIPESSITNLITDLAAKATDTAVVHLAGDTMTGTLIVPTLTTNTLVANGQSFVNINSNLVPLTTGTKDLGGSAKYWSNLFATILNVNATAKFDGSTAGSIITTGLLGLGGVAPTHTLSLSSTTTGIALYNTVDQTTNYERVRQYWNAGIFTIQTEFGGTGTGRDMTVGSASTTVLTRYAQSTSGSYDLSRGLSTAGVVHTRIAGTFTQASGTVTGLLISPNITQTVTAGYTALLVNPTITSVGSGPQLLADFQVGNTSKFKVDNNGNITAVGRMNPRIATATSSATPTPNADTTDNFELTAQAAAGAFATPTGTPTNRQKMIVSILATGAFALTYSAAYANSGAASLPSSTVSGKTITIGLEYDSASSKWICIASDPVGF